MAFEKGTSGNPNGRPKGSTNKITGDIRTKLEEILEGQTNTLEADLLELSPKDRINACTQLLKFILPTLKEVETTGDCPEMPLFLDIPIKDLKDKYDL